MIDLLILCDLNKEKKMKVCQAYKGKLKFAKNQCKRKVRGKGKHKPGRVLLLYNTLFLDIDLKEHQEIRSRSDLSSNLDTVNVGEVLFFR